MKEKWPPLSLVERTVRGTITHSPPNTVSARTRRILSRWCFIAKTTNPNENKKRHQRIDLNTGGDPARIPAPTEQTTDNQDKASGSPEQ